MYLLELRCNGCGTPLEMDAEDRVLDKTDLESEAAERARELAESAVDYHGWRREERRGVDRHYCPTCRLACERRSLVPDAAPEHLPQAAS